MNPNLPSITGKRAFAPTPLAQPEFKKMAAATVFTDIADEFNTVHQQQQQTKAEATFGFQHFDAIITQLKNDNATQLAAMEQRFQEQQQRMLQKHLEEIRTLRDNATAISARSHRTYNLYHHHSFTNYGQLQ